MSTPTTFIIAFASVFGTAEAIRHTQSDARKKEHRSRKNNLTVHCPKSSEYSPLLEGRSIVLSGDKLFVDNGKAHDVPFGHPFAGYFLPFPDQPYSGLVSTITADEPPMMNWIYVDADTYEVKFGTRPWAEANFNGPFDCTRQDGRLIFGGWEGFFVVQEGPFWGLYFDVEQNGLKDKVPEGTVMIDVQLLRTEMKVKPPPKPEPEPEAEPERSASEGGAEADRKETGEQAETTREQGQANDQGKDQADQRQVGEQGSNVTAASSQGVAESRPCVEPQKATVEEEELDAPDVD